MQVEINGITIDYTDQGSGLPVIFIHAFPLNKSMWDEQIEAVGDSYRSIALDLRGHGHSTVAPGPYAMEQMASDIRGLMSALSIEKAVLVGLSMGGYVSFEFYRNYPDAVRAMVLADTRAGSDTADARERRLRMAEKAEREGAGSIADEMEPIAVGPTTRRERPGVVRRMRGMIEANTPQGIAAAQLGMAERRDSSELLAHIDCPVMVVVGSEDGLTPLAEAEKLRDGIMGSRLEEIEGAGHLSNMERPDRFNEILVEFLGSIEPGSTA